MNRKDEIKESIENLNHIIEITTKADSTQEQVNNITLLTIMNQLADNRINIEAVFAESEADDNETNYNG